MLFLMLQKLIYIYYAQSSFDSDLAWVQRRVDAMVMIQ